MADRSHATQVEFSAKHFGMMTVRGHFTEVATSGQIDPENPANSSIEVTINDPGAYTKPFTTRGTARLQAAGDEILEYICQENNIDLIHVNAPAQLP